MPRKTSPSFVAEFPLHVAPGEERALAVRFDASRQIYNAVLGEALRRLDLMRERRAWRGAEAAEDKQGRSGEDSAESGASRCIPGSGRRSRVR
jgi:putative transposase